MLIFPLQSAVSEAYRRREGALMALMNFRATLTNIYLAHATWDWEGKDCWFGRHLQEGSHEGGHGVLKPQFSATPLQAQHTERVRNLLLHLIDAMQELLLIPRRGRSRHEWCFCAMRERDQILKSELIGRAKVLQLLGRLHRAVEDLKAAGMPGNEAARINQYNYYLSAEFEKIWVYKTYRTLTALRAMARVTIFILPFFYGPYFLWIANLGNPQGDAFRSLPFAVAFSCLISTLFTAVLNLAVQLENPFRPDGRDTVRVKEEMDLCRDALEIATNDLKENWWENLDLEWKVLTQASEEDSRDLVKDWASSPPGEIV